MILGIDPGAKGAVALLEATAVPVLAPYPPEPLQDLTWFVDYLMRVPGIKHIFVEKAQAMPGQGVVSMFRYGQHFGELLGVITTMEIPYTLVHPATWTKHMHQGTSMSDAKSRSLAAVKRLFPGVNLVQPRCKRPHEGVIDALLIASYGVRVLTGGMTHGLLSDVR